MIRFALALTVAASLTTAVRAENSPLPTERGVPLIRTFDPKTTTGGPTNWAVVQDQRGVLYVGNESGVLEFDGVRWRKIATEKNTVVRSLAVAPDGRVYVGGVGEIGYIAPNARGEDVYVSLLPKLPAAARQFTDVWCTWLRSDGVYFSTGSQVMRLRGNDVKIWPAETTFAMSYVVRDRFFVRQLERGLYELKGDRLELVPGMERFAVDKIYAMLPWHGNQLLLGTRPSGFFVWDEKTLTPFGSPDLNAALTEQLLYRATLLADGSIAAATTKGGVLLIDRDGTLRMTITEALGLAGDPVMALWSESGGGLWAATTNGVSRIEVPSRLSAFDKRRGLDGRPDTMQRHDGALYVGTTVGLYRLDASATHDARLEPVVGIPNQTWELLDDGDALLAANNEGLYEVRGLQARMLRPSMRGTTTMLRSRRDPNVLYLGLQDGVARMRKVNGKWVDEGALPNITAEARMLAEDAEGRLWASTWGEGMLRITSAPNAAPTVEHFTVADGLPGDNHVGVFWLNGEMHFWLDDGAYVFDEKIRRFVKDARFARVFSRGKQRFLSVAGDHLVLGASADARDTTRVGVARRDAKGLYSIDDASEFEIDGSNVYGALEEGNVTWVGGLDAVMRHDRSVAAPHHQPAALIRRVAQGSSNVFGGTALTRAVSPRLKHSRTAIRFDYGATAYDRAHANKYQSLLEGYDSNWSQWSAETSREFTNLPPGHYTFRLRVRNADGVVGQEATYGFTVLTPWYQTIWAFALYALALLAAIWGFVRWRLWRVNQEKRLLEEKVAQRTRELSAQTIELQHVNAELNSTMSQLERANATLEGLAFLDGLTAVANRRRFEQTLEVEWKRAARDGQPISVIMLDIDHFKMLNDTYGHAVGDDCLRDVAVALTKEVNRPGDLLARYGGEEFVLVLPSTDAEGAEAIGESLRAAVESRQIPNERASRGYVTISVGAATAYSDGESSGKQLLQRADAALYVSKQNGRNRVTVDDRGFSSLQTA